MKVKKILLGVVISLTVFSCNQDDLRENAEKTVETEISQNETQEHHGKKIDFGETKRKSIFAIEYAKSCKYHSHHRKG